MLFTVLFTLIATATATATFANVLGSGKQSSKACSRALESIVYTPANCGYSYLKTISKELTAKTPLLFQPTQVQSIIDAFAAKYSVLVILDNAMGSTAFSTNAMIPTFPILTVSIARAMALGEGFGTGNYSTYSFIIYSYILWNIDGQMYTVNLYLLKTITPTFC